MSVVTERLPMVCVCQPEGKEHAKAMRERVLARLKTTDDMLVSRIVSEMWWNLNDTQLEIDYIAMDMWFGVKVKSADETIAVRVECDRVEDGLCVIMEHLWEKHGRRDDE